MKQKYQPGVRFNHNMSLLETLSFFGEGVGAALYIAATLTGQRALAIVGIVLVIGAVVALLAHLGKPLRAWRAMLRVATSTVSRGTICISAFLGIAILAQGAPLLPPLAPYQGVLTTLSLVAAVPVIIYAGMLLRSMRAIRLWRGPFVPLAFVSHSAASGTTVAACAATGSTAAQPLIASAFGLLLLAAAMSALHLSRAERSVGVQASLARLLGGDLKRRFVFGGGVAGLVVPVVGLGALALMAVQGGAVAGLLAVLVVAARLYGDFAYRNGIVIAGAYEPITPVFPARPLPAAPSR